MVQHKVYLNIVKAIKAQQLIEPFSKNDFKSNCPGFGEGTYKAFLYKHRKGNLGGNTELFELISKGKFRLLRPFKYQE